MTNNEITNNSIIHTMEESINLKLEKKLEEDIRKHILPDDVMINTMTVICDLDIIFNVANIAKYIDLNPECIMDISYGRTGNNMTNRTLSKRKKGKKIKRKKKVFFNQVSLKILIPNKKDKPVNIKLFTNGSIQMTGCKVVKNAIDTLDIIFKELSKIKAIVNPHTMKVEEKPFCNDFTKLNLESIKNIYVAMIVSKFIFPIKINRPNLFKLLTKDSYEVSYNPELHASVDMKYKCGDKKISIFVFEKGSIVITGARNCQQILEAYNFINTYLLTNHGEISKRNMGQNDIEKFLNPLTESESEIQLEFNS